MRKTIIAIAAAAYGTDYSAATYSSADGRTTVALGASQGWQTLRIGKCEKHISAAECGGDIYIRRDTDRGQRWEKAGEKERSEFQKIASAATGSSQIDLTGKNRIADSLVAKKTSAKLSALTAGVTSAGYIPYALMPGATTKCTFTIIGMTGENAVATISGTINANSAIYNGSVDSNVTWSALTKEDKKDASELVAYSIAVVVEADKAADRTGIKVVYIREADHGTAEKASWSELPNAWSYTARRLLLDSNTGNEKEDYTDADYDIMGVQAASTKITTKGRREQTQATEDDWRFIPNTGEYLKLSIESVVLYNKAGIELQRLYEGRYTLEPAAKDRGYEKDPEQTQGNIYANRATEFQTVYFSGDATVEGSELSITSKKTTETDTSGKESCNMVYSGEGTMRLELQNDGKIKYTDGNKNMKTGIDIGYRPTSAATAYPGDDLIPGFKAVYSYDDKSLNGFVFDEEKNYIAVYDKKLLWRANLYIDEGDGDWNNAHPWNAPADSSVESAMVTAKTLPVWWSKNWGYNEWNRTYKLGSDGNMQFGTGNGTQTIYFSENSGWTPVRHAGNTGKAKNKAVAYDYDDEDSGGVIKAKDSPFDYLFKMNEQKKTICKHFSESKDSTLPLKDGSSITLKTQSNVLSKWSTSLAPENKWRYYWNSKVDDVNAYMPGLGLYYHSKDYTEEKEGANLFSYALAKSAGSDCIGFVQRTASYQNSMSEDDCRTDGKVYIWKMLEEDRAEKYRKSGYEKYDPDNISRSVSISFPSDANSSVIISRGGISDKKDYFSKDFSDVSVSEDEFKKFESIKAKFLNIIPGDIIQYVSSPSSHIGEVRSVDYEAVQSANTVEELMGAVNVIESSYSGYFCEVFIRTMRQSNPSGNSNKTEDYSWHLYKEKDEEKLRLWEIRRLR